MLMLYNLIMTAAGTFWIVQHYEESLYPVCQLPGMYTIAPVSHEYGLKWDYQMKDRPDAAKTRLESHDLEICRGLFLNPTAFCPLLYW